MFQGKGIEHAPLKTANTASYKYIAVVQWLPSAPPTWFIRVRVPPDWLLYHRDNRGKCLANHKLLPDILCASVLLVPTCHDTRLVQNVKDITGEW